MKFTSIFLLLFSAMAGFSQTKEQPTKQPYASYWFVHELLEWSPENDPEAKYNVSQIPLAKRFLNDSTPITPDTKIPGIIALMAPYATNNHPAQGFTSVTEYAFPYWQYLDYFVQWGGSAAEGLILAPLPTWTDAAHKNGVRSIGTVFFPPNVYGGKEEWVYEFLVQREDGSFPVADKLIEVAQTYKFDGWFINQETYDLKEGTAEKMIDFLTYYKQRSDLKLVWYDAMIKDSRVIWQDELNHHNQMYFQKDDQVQSDVFFINFRYSATNLEDSKRNAQKLGRSEWDLYAGIDVQAKSFRSMAKWDDLFEDNKPKNTSIGLYFSNSTFSHSKTEQPEDVYDSEQKFWTGGPEFKTRFGTSRWQGFSKFFEPRTVVSDLPFKTNFNYGLGRFYNEKGKRVSDKEWHNHSIQDILPTWQWEVDTLKVRPTFSFTESYEGGSSLLIEANDHAQIPLYKTVLGLDRTVKFEVVAKADPTVQLQLHCLLSNGEERVFPLEKGLQWTKTRFSLDKEPGVRLTRLSLLVKGKGQAFLGEILAYGQKEKRLPAPKFSAKIVSNQDKLAEVFLHIEEKTAPFYAVYALDGQGNKTWLGKTASADYYLARVPVSGTSVQLMVTPLAQDGTPGKSGKKKITVP
ncbi:endo-beta-N-acetylglucosaminidase [Maribacter sp. 2307ULW6-5]|uniref:endo-beta-N-acetylglucosaminidase n=1 Tax=Maribacter sp. 2307ULW6-5 TaxID=3386275 RepID=UPI0039BD8100